MKQKGQVKFMDYSELFQKLTYETAIITFFKKNGEIRVMLATRNLMTANIKFGFLGRSLGGHDNRCNIINGNVAVIDLILGEARSFHVDRIVDVQWLGEVRDEAKLDTIIQQYSDYRQSYESSITSTKIFDSISTDDKNTEVDSGESKTDEQNQVDINSMFGGITI